MKINFFVDKKCIKDKYILEGINDYYKRIRKFVSINILNNIDMDIINSKDSYNINVCLHGRCMGSLEFSDLIKDKSMNRVKYINFIFNNDQINGDSICFIKFDMDPQMLYFVVLEQIYRAYKIINNEPYHK